MYQLKTFRTSAWIVGSLILLAACRKKDTDLKELDNLVNFEAAAQGIAPAENSIQLKLKVSRAVRQDVAVIVNVTPQGLVYGTDFTSTPAVVSGAINAVIPSGATEATITITKVPGALYDGDEKLVMDIYSSANPVIIGANKQFTLSFAELVSSTGSASLDGGGLLYPNKVFFDISANRQTIVNRNTWDLGFYSGADFRVILNSSAGMMVKQVNKTDLTQVNATDTAGFLGELIFSGMNPWAMAYVDHPSGDLTKTAIAEISATAGDNKVYIVNRGVAPGSPAPARGWKKIRVIRNGTGGYTLQHADIAATSFTSVEIPKNAEYFFNYISFEQGAAVIEPKKEKWDFAWTYFTNMTGAPGSEVPYLFQDIVIQNRNVEVVRMDGTTGVTYENFAEANLAGLVFSTNQTTIGSDWRIGGAPGAPPTMRLNRYYILKDGDGNYYKLKFTAITNSNNVRGYPAFEYKLVK